MPTLPFTPGLHAIVPYVFDISTDVLSTTVPADVPYDEWSSLITYSTGDVVTTGSGESTQIWVAQFGQVQPLDPASPLPNLYNEDIDPVQSNTVGLENNGDPITNRLKYTNLGQAWWIEVTDSPYFANRYRMFDDNPSFITEYFDAIEVEIRPQETWNCLALINISADLVDCTLVDGPSAWSTSVDLRYDSPISSEFPNVTDAAFLDLPEVDSTLYPSAKLQVKIYSSPLRIVHLGCLVVGVATKLGLTTYETEVEIADFSRKERDTFGDLVVIERGWASLARMQFELDTVDIAEVRDFLASRRAEATVYVGASNRSELILYGYYKDFSITASDFQNSSGTIEIESFTTGKSANNDAIPVRAVFIEPDGTECIEVDGGATKTLCLTEAGIPIGQAHISILNREIVTGETVTWEMVWLSGGTTLESESSNLSTDCGQTLPVLTWPVGTLSEQGEGTVAIRATITLPDLTEIVSEPAILYVSDCQGQDEDESICFPCTISIPRRDADYGFYQLDVMWAFGWWNGTTFEDDVAVVLIDDQGYPTSEYLAVASLRPDSVVCGMPVTWNSEFDTEDSSPAPPTWVLAEEGRVLVIGQQGDEQRVSAGTLTLQPTMTYDSELDAGDCSPIRVTLTGSGFVWEAAIDLRGIAGQTYQTDVVHWDWPHQGEDLWLECEIETNVTSTYREEAENESNTRTLRYLARKLASSMRSLGAATEVTFGSDDILRLRWESSAIESVVFRMSLPQAPIEFVVTESGESGVTPCPPCPSYAGDAEVVLWNEDLTEFVVGPDRLYLYDTENEFTVYFALRNIATGRFLTWDAYELPSDSYSYPATKTYTTALVNGHEGVRLDVTSGGSAIGIAVGVPSIQDPVTGESFDDTEAFLKAYY